MYRIFTFSKMLFCLLQLCSFLQIYNLSICHYNEPNMRGWFLFILHVYGLSLMHMIPNNFAENGSYYMWCHGCHEPIALSNIYPTGVTWVCQVSRWISLNGFSKQLACHDACIVVYDKSPLVSVASFTKEVNPWLVTRSSKTNGNLVNLDLLSLLEEATEGWQNYM